MVSTPNFIAAFPTITKQDNYFVQHVLGDKDDDANTTMHQWQPEFYVALVYNSTVDKALVRVAFNDVAYARLTFGE
uniref:Uncharacterized protein n=1 Tax=Romanomermis culicivorax TaxID=13658 RepID=A0A915K1L3_ROMCU